MDQAHLRIKAFFGTSENAVKTQLWIAVSVYVLVAIIRKHLGLEVSLYQILQILSVTLFEKAPILVEGIETGEADRDGDQLISLDELYDYAYERVRAERPEQNPRMQVEVEGKIIVARSPRPPRPSELSPELVAATEFPFANTRLEAVSELDKLLRGRNKGLALAAHAALIKLKDDDSRRVATAAENCLNAFYEAQRRSEEEASAERERTRHEAEERTQKQRVQAIAKGRTEAAALLRNGDVPGAIAILDTLIEQHPDSAEIRKDREVAATELVRQQREVQARAEKEADEKARREAEERARKERAEAIAKGRDDAVTVGRKGDLAGATAILDKLIELYPDSAEIRKDREVAATELVRQQQEAQARAEKEAEEKAKREADERAREQRAEAIAKGRDEAATLGQKGDLPGATAILDKLIEQYPDSAEIRRDREAAATELARQQRELQFRAEKEVEEKAKREAEERARKQRVETIAKGRDEAATLGRRGDLLGATAILDKLVEQYPDSAEIRKDREIAATEVAGQRREAQARAEKEAEEKAKREERARKQRAEAIAKGRDEAATLVQKGDLPGATAILDKLMEQYSDSGAV